MSDRRLSVLWVYHSAVQSTWRRARQDALRRCGVDVTVVAPLRWNEGGSTVTLDADPGERVVPVATAGTHPFLFAYDPRPIRKVLRTQRFDVVDIHEEPASVALAEVLAIMRTAGVDTPTVAYSAQNLAKTYPPPFRWFEQRSFRTVRAVHSCNAAVEEVLRSKGFAGEVLNLGLGVDIGRFSPAADAAEPITTGGHLEVGYVGRLEKRKGIFTLLAAVDRTPGTRLTFVGSGPDSIRLDASIAARGLGDRVSVSGFVRHDDLPDVYRSFDVLVIPSISNPSWTEQFGRVVVEAMASGTPVVVSDAGSLPEVAADAGVVVPEDDAAAVSGALERIRDDPALRQQLRRRGLGRSRYFSWDRVAADQAALYRRVAARTSPTSR